MVGGEGDGAQLAVGSSGGEDCAAVAGVANVQRELAGGRVGGGVADGHTRARVQRVDTLDAMDESLLRVFEGGDDCGGRVCEVTAGRL